MGKQYKNRRRPQGGGRGRLAEALEPRLLWSAAVAAVAHDRAAAAPPRFDATPALLGVDATTDRRMRQLGLRRPNGALRVAPVGSTQWPTPTVTPRTVFDGDDRVRVADPTAYPNAAIGQCRIVFPNGREYVGTGVLIDASHVLTAGHCVYSAADGGWATSLAFAPAVDGDDRPFGAAAATKLRAYDEWIDSADPGHDWAVVSLDRNVGDFTGTFGYEARPTVATYVGQRVRTAGYPGDKPTGTQWAAAGTLAGADDLDLYFGGTLDVAGGQSGSPVWRDDSAGQPFVAGVVAYEGPDYNWATRLTPGKFVSAHDWIAADARPADLPDLVDRDAWRSGERARASAAELDPGGTLKVTAGVFNAGTAAARAFDVAFRLSTDPDRADDDVAIGTARVAGGLAAFASAEVTLDLSLPPDLPLGQYDVEWDIDPRDEVREFDGGNNVGRLATPLAVPVDRDDATAEATSLRPGETIRDAIGGAGDVDLFAFPATAGGVYAFDVDASSIGGGGPIDLALRVFDANGRELARVDDASAPGEPVGTLDPYLRFTTPAAGTYYVGVSAADNAEYDAVTGGDDGRTGTTGTYALAFADGAGIGQLAAARPAAVGAAVHATVGTRDDVDVYRVDVRAGERVGFDVDHLAGVGRLDGYLRLFDGGGRQLAANDNGATPGGESLGRDPYLAFTFARGGAYFLGVSSAGNRRYDVIDGTGRTRGTTTGNYRLVLSDRSPVVGGLRAAALSLTAVGVLSRAPGTRVAFYVEANDVAGLQTGPGGDALLAERPVGDGGSSPTVVVTIAALPATAGRRTFYARAAAPGGATSLVATVNFAGVGSGSFHAFV